MGRCSTLYQCFNFLASEKGVISLAPNPDDPRENRLVIRVSDTLAAAISYKCTEEMDFLNRVFIPVCKTLAEQLELEREADNEE